VIVVARVTPPGVDALERLRADCWRVEVDEAK
jgi:hypothetical protein